MGCWGITAMESDTGLNTIACLRGNLPNGRKWSLETALEILKDDDWDRLTRRKLKNSRNPSQVVETLEGFYDLDEESWAAIKEYYSGADAQKVLQFLKERWCTLPKPELGRSHTPPMAVVELMIKFLDGTANDLDEGRSKDRRFSNIESFTATKQTVLWLRGYLCDTLYYAKENSLFSSDTYGGWFEEKDWQDWQDHMETLIQQLDNLLILSEDTVDLCSPLPLENTQEAKVGTLGITQDTFTRELKKQFSCSKEAADRWIHFASDCVKEEKYVEFHRVSNPTAEENRWMEATLAGLKRVRDTLGLDTAQKICELVTESQCPYLFEMQEEYKQAEDAVYDRTVKESEEVDESLKNGEKPGNVPEMEETEEVGPSLTNLSL